MEIPLSLETLPGLLKLVPKIPLVEKGKNKYLMAKFSEHIKDAVKQKVEDEGRDKLFFINQAIASDAFNGLIERVLNTNELALNSLEVSTALSLGLINHLSGLFSHSEIVDVSFRIIDELSKITRASAKLKLMTASVGRSIDTLVDTNRNREEIEFILTNKKLLVDKYFSSFQTDYNDVVTVYYAGSGKTWIDYEPENSLQVSVDISNIPKGFFLLGFDYKSKDGWLKEASRIRINNEAASRERFNYKGEQKGKAIWRL